MKRRFKFLKYGNFIINEDFYTELKESSFITKLNDWDTLENYFPLIFRHSKHYRQFKAFKINSLEIYVKKYLKNIEEAKHEWNNIQLLWSNGFPTSIPVFFYTNGTFAYVGTEKVPGLTFPEIFLERKPKLILESILEIAKFLGLFHKTGFFHQDCYLNHFYLDQETKTLRIIDVSRVLFKPTFSSYYLAKDLSQLRFSFFRYLKEKFQYYWEIFFNEYQKSNRKVSLFENVIIKVKFYQTARHTFKKENFT